jgi:hypothetical protein
MRIVKNDLSSLIFACAVMSELADQTIDAEKREKIRIHQHRIRKVYHLLLTHCSQAVFDLHSLCQQGISDSSETAKSIRMIAPKCDN